MQRVLIHKIINSTTLKQSQLNQTRKKEDYNGEIIGLEKSFQPKEWHRWVYGGERNPK